MRIVPATPCTHRGTIFPPPKCNLGLPRSALSTDSAPHCALFCIQFSVLATASVAGACLDTFHASNQRNEMQLQYPSWGSSRRGGSVYPSARQADRVCRSKAEETDPRRIAQIRKRQRIARRSGCPQTTERKTAMPAINFSTNRPPNAEAGGFWDESGRPRGRLSRNPFNQWLSRRQPSPNTPGARSGARAELFRRLPVEGTVGRDHDRIVGARGIGRHEAVAHVIRDPFRLSPVRYNNFPSGDNV